jgi:hypothetical protein
LGAGDHRALRLAAHQLVGSAVGNYDRVLTEAEIAAVNAYLADRYPPAIAQ